MKKSMRKNNRICMIGDMKAVVVTFMMLAITIPVMASADNISLNIKDSNGTNQFVVMNSGRVGIGTSAPLKPIEVVSSYVAGAQISSRVVGEDPGGGGYTAYNNRTNTLALSGDRLGYIYFGSLSPILDTSNPPVPTPLNAAGISGRAEANFTYDGTTRNMPAYLAFETTPPNSNGRLERMRITSMGNVGIGATAPTQQLEINGGVRLNTVAGQPACDAASRGTFWFIQSQSGADVVQVCAYDSNRTLGWKMIPLQ